MNVELGTVVARFLSGNICFEFSAFVLCSAFKRQYQKFFN